MSSTKLTPGKKRAATTTTPGPPAVKRQKRLVDDTGRISTAAVLAEQSVSSASSYLSIRERPLAGQVRPLTSLALSVVAESFDTLFLDENGQVRHGDEGTQASIAWLRLLSPRIANRLLELLLERYAEALSDGSGSSSSTRITVAALSSLFLHPSASSITHFELPQSFFRAAQKQYDPSQRLENDPENILTESTFTSGGKGDSGGQTEALKQKALARAARDRSNLLTSLARCTTLRSLSLAGQANLQDTACAELVKHLAQLEELSLKGCTEVGDQTVIALARQSGKNGVLRVLNLNYTAVTVRGLKSLFARCKTLEVLKLANVNGLNDANVQALVDPTSYMAADWLVSPLARLQTLKLRSTKVGDHGLRALLTTCTSLSSLDISYTQVRSLDAIANLMVSHTSVSMEKLVLSGLSLRTQTALQKFFKAIASRVPEERRKSLHTLKLGTLDLLDAVLAQIVPHLEQFTGLRKVSLFSNDKLGLGSGTGLRTFLERIAARRLRVLDLSCVPLGGRKLNSLLLDDGDDEDQLGWDSAGDEAQDKGGPRLRTLIMNRSQVDDEACLAISTLRNLEELHLEQGRVSIEGMKLVMQGCSRLRVLDLTGCRGIPTKQRRDWFDAYARGEVGREG